MAPGRPTIVFVLDGLRPDCITAEDTPTLYRLRAEGVNFLASHATFPTVTRVNATVLATGRNPGANGVLGNTMYVPAVDRSKAFSNAEWKNLVRVDEVTGGRLVFVETLAERLAASGLRYAAVSSGSTGSAWFLNPRAPRGVQVLINGYFDREKLVAYPPEVNAAVLARFGAAPPKGGKEERYDSSVDWTQAVLRDYVLPELRPDVVINWLTEPDHIQHALGANSPQARAAIRNNDRHVGEILARVDANVFVVSDHGLGVTTFAVNVARELIDAGLKAGPESDDVVVASSGQTIGLHVKGAARDTVQRIVAFLQSRAWIDVIFTAHAVEGTFPLALINAENLERGPEIMFTFPWTSAPNTFGLQGTDYGNTSGVTGPVAGNASDHGSMSPWTVRNTMLAWGPAFKRGVTVRVPAGNVDVMPTVLAIHGLGVDGLDGRVLHEALAGGPDEEQVTAETRAHTAQASNGAYRAVLQISEVAGRRYVDKSWRVV